MEYKKYFNRLCIFDGSFALHRNLAEPHNFDMKNSKGKRTGGVFGVLRTILKELKTYNYYPIVIFDGGLSERRLSIYPNYKGNEDKKLLLESTSKTETDILNEEFKLEYNTQREDLINLLHLFGIPTICIANWEGDDLIYILSKMCKDSIVISDDKDLIQLIYDPAMGEDRRCRIRRPMKDELLDVNYLNEQNINIDEFIGCKAIVGDPSDNIPTACFQVGPKTALGLYKLYEAITVNETNFPQEDAQLSKLCTELKIPKRTAYLNFNENQFLSNILLTDLSLVDNEVSNELCTYIYTSIITQSEDVDLQAISIILKELEIITFQPKELIDRVNILKILLGIENKDKCIHIKDINCPGRLF